MRVNGDFNCYSNRLVSLVGAPSYVETLDCRANQITSLEGAPSRINGNFYCHTNKLASLKDIHLHTKYIGMSIFLQNNPIRSHVLGLLLIDGLQDVLMTNGPLQAIIRKYLPSDGIESALLCQEELIMAGLEEYAQL